MQFVLLTPSPGPLEWKCTPSVLHNWFQKWRSFWEINWVGGKADELKLLKLIKVNLPVEWVMALSDFDWETQTVQQLYELMDMRLNVYWPPLKRTINLLTSFKKSKHETHWQFMVRVMKAMETGGLGTRLSFALTWDKLIILLVMKGLPNADLNKILLKFNTLELSFNDLSSFMHTLSAISENSSSKNNSIISKQQKNAPNLAKSRLKTASVVNCNGNNQNLLNNVAASNKCNKTINTTDYQSFHTKSEGKVGFVDAVHKHESSLSKFKYDHSPRVKNEDVTQKSNYAEILPNWLNNGSTAKVMPSTLATSIHLDTQPVSPLKPSKTKCKNLKEIVNSEQQDESSLSKYKYINILLQLTAKM